MPRLVLVRVADDVPSLGCESPAKAPRSPTSCPSGDTFLAGPCHGQPLGDVPLETLHDAIEQMRRMSPTLRGGMERYYWSVMREINERTLRTRA